MLLVPSTVSGALFLIATTTHVSMLAGPVRPDPALRGTQACSPPPTPPNFNCPAGVTCSEHCYGPRPCTDAGGQCLNVFRPSTPTVDATLLWIHGGGWSTEYAGFAKDNSFHIALGRNLASLGVPVVSCNYYLSGYNSCTDVTTGPPANFVETIKDIKRVMDWIRGPEGTSLMLPPRIVVAGTSAGAHLAAMVATTQGGGSEKLYDPDQDPLHIYTCHLAILYSPPLDFVRMGCEGIPLTTNCLECFDASDCTPCTSPFVRTSPVPAGYPCKDLANGVCYDSAFQEWFLGQKWNPVFPPLWVEVPGNPQGLKKYKCSNYPRTPVMPTGNRWFDASPINWVGANEPVTYIMAAACDKWVSVAESQDFAQRMTDYGNVCVLNTTSAPAPCSAGCGHSAELLGTSSTIAMEIWSILLANP